MPELVLQDPRRDELIRRLARLADAGVPITDLLRKVTAGDTPLPDGCAADALWWRVVRHLGPAALHASSDTTTDLRPAWVPTLTAALGAYTAHRVMADPAWPALVAAIGARPTDWTAEALVAAIVGPQGPALPAEDLCTALVWRAAIMTDPPTDPEDEPPAAYDVEPSSAGYATPPSEAEDLVPTTSVERIVQLNHWALEHYEELYPRSWAPAYLRQRLGTDLVGNDRFRLGYAAPGPTHLIRVLTARGATHNELLHAGLARRRDDGQIVDVFRDRLMFPIWTNQGVVGFVARRNPTKEGSPYSGPKYLNTRSTEAFTKGDILFGLCEGLPTPEGTATPVLVEGPLDAIATTITAPGYVGVAPLGTAFTEHQASLLKQFFRRDPSNIVVATDADAAGARAARKAFWQLTALGADPQCVRLPAGLDPAALHQIKSGELSVRLRQTQERLGSALLRAMLANTDPQDTAARIWFARDAARVIAALPPTQWPTAISTLVETAGLPPGLLEIEVLDAAQEWDEDPLREARHQIKRGAIQERVSQRPHMRQELPTALAVPRETSTRDPAPTTRPMESRSEPQSPARR